MRSGEKTSHSNRETSHSNRERSYCPTVGSSILTHTLTLTWTCILTRWSSDDIEILHNLMASDSSYGETIRTDPSFLDLLMDVVHGMEKEADLV